MRTIKLVVFLLFSCSLLWGQSADALYTKIASVYSELSSFQAEVKQDNYYAQIKKSISYRGKIYFTRGRMVIRFDKPNFQRLAISGGYVDLYDAQSKTVFRSRMKPEFGKMNPVEILQSYWKKSKVTILDKQGDISKVRLVPFNDPLIASLTASINTKTGLVQTLGYTDANGNKVDYSFSGIKTNNKIPASIWEYTYPKEVQVVQQ
jgi:outer membrane lipoprotein-sorting protein